MENIIRDFATAWKTLNPELIIKHLSPDFQYDSQWVFDSLDKNGYSKYIRGKFKTLKDKSISIGVEIIDDPHLGGKMLKLIQSGQEVYYRINVSNTQVNKADMCMF